MLEELIFQMNKEEVRHFKLFANRTHSKGGRKDLLLFDWIRKSPNKFDENKAAEKLYPGDQKNAFYRLKNRLKEQINKSILLQYYGASDENEVLFNLALSRHFAQKQNHNLANHYLKKAQKKAQEVSGYELLDIIYTDFIKLSQETLAVNAEEYIEKRKNNRTKLLKIQEIDDLLAALIYRIRSSYNFSKQNYKVLDVLKSTVEEFSSTEGVKESPLLRFKIYHAVSRILLQERDYVSLEEYLLRTLQEFEQDALFTKNNHETKLQLLTYLVNSFFKNNKLEKSLDYAERLRKEMEKHGGFLKTKYQLYYYSALVYNYSVLDKEKALRVLEEALEIPAINKTPHNRIALSINFAVLHFELGNHKRSNKHLIKIKLDDGYLSMDKVFRLNLSVSELINLYELGDHDFLEYQILQVKKEFEEELKEVAHARQREMVEIIHKLIYAPKPKKEEDLGLQIEQFTSKTSDEEAGEMDFINYNKWLKEKVK